MAYSSLSKYSGNILVTKRGYSRWHFVRYPAAYVSVKGVLGSRFSGACCMPAPTPVRRRDHGTANGQKMSVDAAVQSCR
ncbi:hypothetical protein HBI56_232750 [Parastagonospora nodorum]|uniref:Uncharacterized protein n=1 Tax=Phaeosphaeria nodorum (strain SN15 / ATCC MYA-4574 / FGSC 10173) TaxID=321614 RepID=A0A7U2F8U3_PHANO|nr:hypothetical protein HBH56_200650 [Parastagonospora nodorum]QRD00797.1 hypothetical protein JI435_415790 [Parastagonospora nodorum SN15]KAH3925906.1 hypothetical protein HBH54_175650 [Parastagonospora nodorum]KAH3953176.1 hypothetical protein HBH53_037030 [Parastagonospora nodorum]KAH3976581.1 hypothetical protein HBH52_121640 [Parastagonospora nodorum]